METMNCRKRNKINNRKKNKKNKTIKVNMLYIPIAGDFFPPKKRELVLHLYGRLGRRGKTGITTR